MTPRKCTKLHGPHDTAIDQPSHKAQCQGAQASHVPQGILHGVHSISCKSPRVVPLKGSSP